MPPKISLGSQHGRSKLNLQVGTRPESTLELKAGKQFDDSTREVSVMELPASIDSLQLAEELSRILTVARSGKDPVDSNTVEALRSAESAARRGDRSDILAYLKTAGSWALDTATKIGVEVAGAAIKSSLNLK